MESLRSQASFMPSMCRNGEEPCPHISRSLTLREHECMLVLSVQILHINLLYILWGNRHPLASGKIWQFAKL